MSTVRRSLLLSTIRDDLTNANASVICEIESTYLPTYLLDRFPDYAPDRFTRL